MCNESKCEPAKFEPIDFAIFEWEGRTYLIRQGSPNTVHYYIELQDCSGRKYWNNQGDIQRPQASFLIAVLKAVASK